MNNGCVLHGGLVAQSPGGQLTGMGPGGQGVDPALVRYLEEHQGHARVLVVTDTTNIDALILATNRPVMPLSGFSSYPLTTSAEASMVVSGTVRFFLLSGGGGAPSSPVTSWVAQHCTIVPPKLWQSTSSSSQASEDAGPGAELQLYDCAAPH